MKKMLLLLAGMALVAGTAAAQTSAPSPERPVRNGLQQGPEQRTPEQRAATLAKQLGLSARQTEQVRQLEESRRQEMQALRAQRPTGDDRSALRQTMEALRTKYDAQLKGILSADQYARYGQLQDNRMEKRQDRKTKIKS
ncbi:hypothetical protein [Hymenobacter rubripertinctus]|uniref:DUF4890 domain-containing protein n=1 Tax=Hymenobacter rubripertinctus TaxID=2029981 RepID=A0A418QQJ6_9BACT|nr:hypothetical protein [Hymenobacter rubripertinctus]RIY07358.1 hypothetical protein D0T11_16665 [Hymenobacter rubripertinctus]